MACRLFSFYKATPFRAVQLNLLYLYSRAGGNDTIIKINNYNLIVYFKVNRIASVHLGELVKLWKSVIKKYKGKFAFWDSNVKNQAIDTMKNCKLDMLFPRLDSLDKAMRYIKD